MTSKLLVQIDWAEPATRWHVDIRALQMQIEQDARFRVLQATAGRMPHVQITIEEAPEDETPKPSEVSAR